MQLNFKDSWRRTKVNLINGHKRSETYFIYSALFNFQLWETLETKDLTASLRVYLNKDDQI